MDIGLAGVPDVKTTDFWFAELRAGRAFMGAAAPGPVAAQYPHVQLLNPSGSGKIILVRFFVPTPSAIMMCLLLRYDTALTTNSPNVGNLLVGGAAPSGEVRHKTDVAILGTRIGQQGYLADEGIPFGAEWIAELDAGEGLVVAGNLVNTTLPVMPIWVERGA